MHARSVERRRVDASGSPVVDREIYFSCAGTRHGGLGLASSRTRRFTVALRYVETRTRARARANLLAERAIGVPGARYRAHAGNVSRA